MREARIAPGLLLWLRRSPSKGRSTRRRAGGTGLERGEEKGVGAEGVNVIEALGETLYVIEAAWVGLVDDGVSPPGTGAHAGADPAGTGQSLGDGGRGEEECKEEGAAGGHGRVSVSGVVEMVADFLGLVEVAFVGVFCKKRWITRGKKCGNRGKRMVNGG